jgi:hypothetical protein
VDLQYQVRTFPLRGQSGATEHANENTQQEGDPTSAGSTGKALPGILGLLSRRVRAAKETATELLSSFAIAMRSSHVADFYATKYLAKPQQWLANVLGPLIVGLRRAKEKQEQAQEQPETKALALSNVRTAIFAANRCVWISCCEACLYLQTASSAVQSHLDVVVHGRKGLFMMHECKRILNHEVAGTGLWQADLAKCTEQGEGDCLQVHAEPAEDNAGAGPEEGSEDEEVAETEGAAGHAEAERAGERAQQATENVEEDEETLERASRTEGAAEHAEAERAGEGAQQGTENAEEGESAAQKKARVQIFQMTISLRDDWLHRGDALQDMDLQTYAEHIERKEKPMRGVDMQRMLRLPIFAFDSHYKLAARYAQVLKTGSRRCIARFNLPNCLRENVNEGEENAQFKAFHCSLLRCPGTGHCAEPLMCASVLFLGKDGKHRFRPSWRARESEILTLAIRGQEKKKRARRLETLHDTSLCRAHVATDGSADAEGATEHVHGNANDSAEIRTASRHLQIDLQRLFRQRIRSLREDACAERPCVYGYPERVVHAILGFVGTSFRECDEDHLDKDRLYLVGIPLWHEDQLHLAEWQALQQLEFLFNLTLAVDAKNTALEKLKAHKGSTSADADAEGVALNNPLNSRDGEDLEPVADDDLVPPDEPRVNGALLPLVTDQQILLRILGRVEEVAQARRLGQGRREAFQSMREMADAFGSPEHLRSHGHDPSRFGAAEQEKTAALARHQACLETLRTQRENNPTVQGAMVESTGAAAQEEGVDLLQAAGENLEMLDPVALAKWLCDKAMLTLEQRGPVALIARDMQKVYEAEMQRRAGLTEARREALACGVAGHALLPLKGRISRLLLYGGGGCAKQE